jgi:hypothetical protein
MAHGQRPLTTDPRAYPERIELPAEKRDLLVRYRGTASRAEWVSAGQFAEAAIWCGSSPGAEVREFGVYA